MKKITASGFQFTNPRTKKIMFQVNEKFDKSGHQGLEVEYEVKVSERKELSAVVELEIRVGKIGNETPFYMDLVIKSDFRWTDDLQGSEEVYLKQNAVVLLMSYARPIIAHTTVDAGFRPFNLPFVDLRNDIAEMES